MGEFEFEIISTN